MTNAEEKKELTDAERRELNKRMAEWFGIG